MKRRKQPTTPRALDEPWHIDFKSTTMLEVPIRDDTTTRLIVELQVTDFKPDELRAIAQHIVAVHNAWIERQQHLDRQNLPRCGR